MAEKSLVQKFLERVKGRKCEDGHELPPGKNYCPDCGKPQATMTLTTEQRLSELEAVVAEFLETYASPDKKDDAQLAAKVGAAMKWLVTPQTPTKKEK